MRVISGSAKGHKLKAPDGMDTRPTTDKIKESLFNIIAPDLMDTEFLDLFAGSGAIGIEALSRGTKKAVFVDNSRRCSDIIKYNLAHTKLQDKAQIHIGSVMATIKLLGAKGYKFDIIFMDPPYNSGLIEPTITAISAYEILKKDGYIIVEIGSTELFPKIEGFKIIKRKGYKTSTMVFLASEE